MSLHPNQVLLAPHVSEKSYSLIDEGRYTFVVHPSTNKTEIKEAVQSIWNVRVLQVNTMNRQGKVKRFRYTRGKRPDQKLAVVTLAAGDAIEIFEQK